METILFKVAKRLVVFAVMVALMAMFPVKSDAAKIEPQLLAALAQGGEASYLVYLQEQADLAQAGAITEREARGLFVYKALKEVADRTQDPLLAYLATEVRAGRAKEVKSFFSVNAIGVTSTEPTLRGLAAFPGVEQIIKAPVVSIPEPLLGIELPTVNGVEWNIAKVRAPEVWAKGVFGQGVVVANIDTGVQYNHPALVNQYRGNIVGVFNHNYNWWDPSKVCGNPSNIPCDNSGHGTHTMGTMVGDDGGSNQIGVAPQAEWLACKGCETNSCSSFALLECGDFILAPWNLNKANPDPSKRPHVVNNSWGGGSGDSWYQGVVQSWRAAGIFPAFANGNSGPSCNTSGSPGDYPESFSSGATDINDNIASFSSRGPSAFGVKKPDISAPGVSVRSSVPTNSYSSYSGTSMASPHTAGEVALLWSLYPGLSRDIPNTERKLRPATQILNTTAGCGGDGPTTHPNNVFGWGREDAFQAYSPFNIYTDRSVYNPGGTMNVMLSLVSPLNTSTNVDAYVAVQTPGGQLLFFPGFGITPVPYISNYSVAPLLEVFDFNILSYAFGSEAPGNYNWFSVLTPPGADPLNPANRVSLDAAPFTKE
jgi:subtilisin family serine protease